MSLNKTLVDPTRVPPILDLGRRLTGRPNVTATEEQAPFPGGGVVQTPIYDAMPTGEIPTVTASVQDLPSQPQTPLADDVDQLLREDEQDRLDQLLGWWTQLSHQDAEECLIKLIEYGSADLDIMAHGMLSTSGTTWDGADEGERLRIGREMAIAFYLQGKVARMFGAYKQGRLPSDDTLNDITRYSMMLRRIRQFGTWG